MKKPIKDMTSAEKMARIDHLSHKFNDINERPSCLVRDEMQYGESDEYMLNALKNLELLETERYKIEEECTKKLAQEMRQWRGIFTYEDKELAEKQERERIVPPFDPFRHHNRAETAKRHQQELEYLKRQHQETSEKIRSCAMSPLKMHDKRIYYVFMDAVKHLYR